MSPASAAARPRSPQRTALLQDLQDLLTPIAMRAEALAALADLICGDGVADRCRTLGMVRADQASTLFAVLAEDLDAQCRRAGDIVAAVLRGEPPC